MRVVLDTNVLISGDLEFTGLEVAVSSLTWAELLFGVTCAEDPIDRAARALRYDTLRRALGSGLVFDDAAAEIYGTLTQLVASIGRNPRRRAIDLMIAATAHANGAAVLTYNVDDFRGVDQVVRILDASDPGRGRL